MRRREFLTSMLAAPAFSQSPPAARVALARCPYYSALVYETLRTMLDQLGGLAPLVTNKTVAIKVNLTGPPELKLFGAPVGSAQWVHWGVIVCLLNLLDEAGARRIRVCESAGDTSGPLAAFVSRAGWDPSWFLGAARDVELVNTNSTGESRSYSRFTVPYGGYLFPGFDLHPAYEECDVFVSLTKLKQHVRAGVTLSMKNVFGMLPLTIYGTNAGVDEPGTSTSGFRGEVMHVGKRPPSLSAPQEVNPDSPRNAGYRLPRVITDLCAARPIHLAIIDGIETMAGGEGPWTTGLSLVRPGVLIAGFNPVATDAVATAIMGFDPMAPGGEGTFRAVDNTMDFAEQMGLGTRDLRNIEVTGERIQDLVHPFGPLGAPTEV
jgi:uncharacterized protein (DUF362 family)